MMQDQVHESVKISYEYSYADFKESIRQHLRHRVRKTARIFGSVLCVFSWAAWIFLVLLLRGENRTLDLDLYLFPVVLTILSVIFLLLNPALVARMQKRRFRHMFGERHSWGFTSDGFEMSAGDRSHGTGKWQNFTHVVQTRSGLLLYYPSGVFNWLPMHAFADHRQFDTLIALATANGLKIIRRD